MRNDAVKANIQKQYKSLTGDVHPFPIFVVGNQAYDVYQQGFMPSERPLLTLQQTNIPALRTAIYSLPADGKLNETLHIAQPQGKISDLLHTLTGYCSKTHVARKEDLESVLLKLKKNVKRIRRDASSRLSEKLTTLVLDPMRADETSWVKQAQVLCKGWVKK
jgi:hypothetical protein